MIKKWIPWMGVVVAASILLVTVARPLPLKDSGAPYKVIDAQQYAGSRRATAEKIESTLNREAEEGWQLVAVDNGYLILKR